MEGLECMVTSRDSHFALVIGLFLEVIPYAEWSESLARATQEHRYRIWEQLGNVGTTEDRLYNVHILTNFSVPKINLQSTHKPPNLQITFLALQCIIK